MYGHGRNTGCRGGIFLEAPIFHVLTFLCALACSSTYRCTSLISSWSFFTRSMWQPASFSVELRKMSHIGANVLLNRRASTLEDSSLGFLGFFFWQSSRVRKCISPPKLREVASRLGEFGHRPSIGLFNGTPTKRSDVLNFNSEFIIYIYIFLH